MKKMYIIDYEKAVGISVIPFGGIMFLSSFLVMAAGYFMWLPAMLIGAGCIAFGIYKLVDFRKKEDEFDDFRRMGKKLTGRIIAVENGSNVNSSKKNTTSVVAVCLATDEETGEEKRYYSRKVICGGGTNIGGMTADVYVYSTGQYYVDLRSVRHEAEERGKKVYDFR